MKKLLEFLLKLASVDLKIFYGSEARDRKLISALVIFIPISSFLAGFALFTAVQYLAGNFVVALIIGLAVGTIILLHDLSLVTTEKSKQIVMKIVMSVILALIFTLTNTASRDQEALRNEIVQEIDVYNADLELLMNEELDDIEREEQAIQQRIEEAGKMYRTNRQPLIDGRRSLKKFVATKEARMKRITEAYTKKFKKYDISETDVLRLQGRKMISNAEGALVGILLAFLFFVLESLPALIRVLLIDGDYLKKYILKIESLRELRDQMIDSQKSFVSRNGQINRELITRQIIEGKKSLILNDFEDQTLMAGLAHSKELLNAGINPYTMRPLTDLNIEDSPPEHDAEAPPVVETADSNVGHNSGDETDNIIEFF